MIMKERKSSVFRPLLWAATIAIGFGTLWTLLAVCLLAAIDDASQGTEGIAWEQLVVRSDGTPLIVSNSRANLSVTTYRDLGGREQEAPDRDHLLSGVTMPGEPAKPGFLDDPPGWAQRLTILVNEQEPTVIWYFVHDGKPEGAGYFVGYERKSNRQVGFIGLSGFRPRSVPIDEWIPVRLPRMLDYSQWSSAPTSIYSGSVWDRQGFRPEPWDLPPHVVHVPSANRLRLVDLATRTVRTVFETAEPIESLGVPTLSAQAKGHASKEQPILIRTGRQIRTLNHNYQITRLFPVPADIDLRGAVTWYEIGDGQAIAEFTRPLTTRGAFQVMPLTIYRIAADGTIRDRSDVLLQNGMVGLTQGMGPLLLGLAVPVPMIVAVVEPLILMGVDRARNYPAALSVMMRDSWPSILGIFTLAFVLAVAARRRARVFGLSEREQYAWAVFVFLLGLPAYAGFLLCRRWPIRLPCPNCDVRAPRDRAACSECGTPFPDPTLKGIEIFA